MNQQSLSACCSANCKRESLGLSHSRRPQFSWAPGNLQLPETTCRASLTCEKDTSVIPPLCPSLNCSAYKGGSQTPTLPVLFPAKVFHSEKCLGAEITGFHPGGDESSTDGGVEGEVIFTSHCLVCTISDLAQLSLTSTHWSSAIFPPTQSLTYHVYSLGLESWAEGRTSHHK